MRTRPQSTRKNPPMTTPLPPLLPDRIISRNIETARTPTARQRWENAAEYSRRRHNTGQHTDPQRRSRVYQILGRTAETERAAREQHEQDRGDDKGHAKFLRFHRWAATR